MSSTQQRGRLRAAARQRALTRLSALHPQEFNELHNEERAERGLPPLGANAAHGSRSAQAAHLRVGEPLCDVCAEAENLTSHQAFIRSRREKRANGTAVIPHGTENSYVNWGCRCDECKTAASAAKKARTAAKSS